jgi:hypothetical protein
LPLALCAVRSGDAGNLLTEIHMPRAAAELPVGHSLAADLLLHQDRIADSRVLDVAKLRGRTPASVMLGSRL